MGLKKEALLGRGRLKSSSLHYYILSSLFSELSLYELHRTPQEAITDGTEISISPRSLHSELMCPICLDMLKNTMTTKEVGVQVCSSVCYMHSYIKIDQFSLMFFCTGTAHVHTCSLYMFF